MGFTIPLSQEFQNLLGPVTYETLSRDDTPMQEVLHSLFPENVPPLLKTM